MPAPTIQQIRKGLADRIDTVPGLRVEPRVPDKISPPAANVALDTGDFDQTFGRGQDRYTFRVRIYASRASDRAGQDRLDEFLTASGATSVRAAIGADPTLGGIVHDAHAAGISNYGVYEVGGIEYYGADLTVNVIASGI